MFSSRRLIDRQRERGQYHQFRKHCVRETSLRSYFQNNCTRKYYNRLHRTIWGELSSVRLCSSAGSFLVLQTSLLEAYTLACLVTRIAATSKSQIASDCNRNSIKKLLRIQKHPRKPNLWTREPPVLCGFYSVSEAPHGSGNPPEYVATTRV